MGQCSPAEVASIASTGELPHWLGFEEMADAFSGRMDAAQLAERIRLLNERAGVVQAEPAGGEGVSLQAESTEAEAPRSRRGREGYDEFVKNNKDVIWKKVDDVEDAVAGCSGRKRDTTFKRTASAMWGALGNDEKQWWIVKAADEKWLREALKPPVATSGGAGPACAKVPGQEAGVMVTPKKKKGPCAECDDTGTPTPAADRRRKQMERNFEQNCMEGLRAAQDPGNS